jgi:hypothetical protein
MVRFAWVACALLLPTALTRAVTQPVYEENLPREHPAIRYSSEPTSDVIETLAGRLQGGALTLAVDPAAGVLPSLLKHLDINPDSQTLVFSKTSLQQPMVSPRSPRAVYFNDEAAVATIPGGGAIELAAMDPRQGAQFYLLQGRESPSPVISRRQVCLECHHGVATLGVPGMFVSSVFTSASGLAEREGAIVTDHRTPLAERWGGWYVTGTHGRQRHRGNAVAWNPAEPTSLEVEGSQNLTRLDGRFDLNAYLSPTSDLVALMTLEHQTFMLNLLTRLGWEARMSEHDRSAKAQARLDSRIREVVRYMLFMDEAPLRGPLAGVSSFAQSFAARGPTDRRGRSLREFDLKRRLFRYPLSYIIYSRTFDALPPALRDRVYRGLYDGLLSATGADSVSPTDGDRTAVVEIVRDTKPGLPEYWASHGR